MTCLLKHEGCATSFVIGERARGWCWWAGSTSDQRRLRGANDFL